MKLLVISTSSWTAFNREFYRRLKSETIDLKLVIPKYWDFGKGPRKAEEIEPNDPDIVFLEPTNYHHRLYLLKGIKKLIIAYNPDVIYYEGDPGSIMSIVLGYHAKKRAVKYIALSCENLSQNPLEVVKREGIKNIFNAVLKFLMIKYSQRKIDCLFVINTKGLNYFRKLGFKHVVKTPLGFNENVFNLNEDLRQITRKKLNLEDNTIVIAYFGRLVFEKGVHLLLQALKTLEKENWIFLIDEFNRYGGDYQIKIQNEIKNSKLNNKTIFFEADHSEISNFMNASDIVVLPSIPTKKWEEQYGRVVPEALACGNLIVFSNKGAQQEFFSSDYPFKYQYDDVNALKFSLEKAMEVVNLRNYDKEKNSNAAQLKFGLNSQMDIFKDVIFTKIG